MKKTFFFKYNDVKIYHVYKDGDPLLYWYNEGKFAISAFGNDGDAFDIRQLYIELSSLGKLERGVTYNYFPASYQAPGFHEEILRLSIESGLIKKSESFAVL